MFVYPSSAPEKLGFHVVLREVSAALMSLQGSEVLSEERPSDDAGVIRERLAQVSEAQALLQFDDPLAWPELPDIRLLIKSVRPAGSVPETTELLDARLVLHTASQLRRYIDTRKKRYPALASAVVGLADYKELTEIIAATVGHDGRILDSASPELSRIRKAIFRRENDLRDQLNQELRRAVAAGHATEDQPTIRNGRMVIPVRAEARRKVRGFVQDTSGTGQTVYIEPETCLDLNNEIRELAAAERQEERRVLQVVADLIRARQAELGETLDAMAVFDVIRAKAHVANRLGAVVPSFGEGSSLSIRSGRNPVLVLRYSSRKDSDETRTVVPLDIDIYDERRVLIVTGPNAGGKTVALGTIGLFALMTAHGIPIPADEKTVLPVFRKLLVDIGDEQSIENDLSTFSAHMLVAREIVEKADENTLVLIDEAGTGTDPEEGAALAQSLLEHLGAAGAWTVVTTHHGRLKAFAHEADFARNAAMEFDRKTLAPTFSLKLDVPGSSYAFDIGRRAGLPKAVLDRARELTGVAKAHLEDLIAEHEERLAELTTLRDQARTSQVDAEKLRSSYEAAMAELKQNRAQIKADALRQAEEILRGANAEVERTIRQIKEAQAERESTRKARDRLDDARRELRALRSDVQQELQPPVRARDASSALQVGDRVVLDDGSTVAHVEEIDPDGEEVVITSGSLHMRVARSRLRRVGGRAEQKVEVRQVGQSPGKLATEAVRQRLDVRGKRVEEALTDVSSFIDRALPSSLDRLEVLHGKGTGALREAIHGYLAERSDVVSFEEADWEQGGAGVTVIFLR